MKTQITVLSLLMAVLSIDASAQIKSIGVQSSCSYYGEEMAYRVKLFTSDREAENVISRIVDTGGISRNFEIRAAGVPNAAAVIDGDKRYILYNQQFIATMQRSLGHEWGAISVMAHEVGHHLNGHTLIKDGSRPDLELEADYYSGFVLQKLGASLDQSLAAMDAYGTAQGTYTHPPKRDRLAAISKGWTKSCGNASRCSRGEASGSQSAERRPAPRTVPRTVPRTSTSPPQKPGPNSCKYARDGECDEPDICARGTDTHDCTHHTTPGGHGQPSTTSHNHYCCDAWGQRRCASSLPVGVVCFCPGIGYGISCH